MDFYLISIHTERGILSSRPGPYLLKICFRPMRAALGTLGNSTKSPECPSLFQTDEHIRPRPSEYDEHVVELSAMHT